jgi:hypothetical protein
MLFTMAVALSLLLYRLCRQFRAVFRESPAA